MYILFHPALLFVVDKWLWSHCFALIFMVQMSSQQCGDIHSVKGFIRVCGFWPKQSSYEVLYCHPVDICCYCSNMMVLYVRCHFSEITSICFYTHISKRHFWIKNSFSISKDDRLKPVWIMFSQSYTRKQQIKSTCSFPSRGTLLLTSVALVLRPPGQKVRQVVAERQYGHTTETTCEQVNNTINSNM